MTKIRSRTKICMGKQFKQKYIQRQPQVPSKTAGCKGRDICSSSLSLLGWEEGSWDWMEYFKRQERGGLGERSQHSRLMIPSHLFPCSKCHAICYLTNDAYLMSKEVCSFITLCVTPSPDWLNCSPNLTTRAAKSLFFFFFLHSLLHRSN